MKFKPTKGPWFYFPVTRDRGEGKGFSISTCESEAIQDVTDEDLSIAGIWGNTSKDEANARLIAAAPDLLEVLKNANELLRKLMPGVAHICIQDFDFLNSTMRQVDAIIRKAEGE